MIQSAIKTGYALLGGMLLACALPAAAVTLEPGKWEMIVESRNPMTGQPITKTTVECIETGEYDPSEMVMDNQDCRMLDMQDTGKTVTWKMECTTGEGMPAMVGEGHFTSQGKTAAGEMIMKMSLSGTNMEMKHAWQGRFVGAKCE